MHGTAVCDLGITVDVAADPVNRAQRRDANPFHQLVGPSNVWSVEFTRSDNVGKGTDLMRIDHLAQTVSYHEMSIWSLIHTTLVDMGKSPMVNVVVPDALVRSRALETTDGVFHITLNGAETHCTMAGNFLVVSFGASVQPIALASADIFATSAAMAAIDFRPLQILENDYADLAARFDLDAPMLDRLRTGNILYDEDLTGTFFQFYSRSYAGGNVLRYCSTAIRIRGLRCSKHAVPDRRAETAHAPNGMPKR